MRNNKKLLLKNYSDNGFFVIKSLFSTKELKIFDNEILNITKKLKKNFSRPFVNLTKDNKLNTAHNLDQIFPRSCLMKIPQKKEVFSFNTRCFWRFCKLLSITIYKS